MRFKKLIYIRYMPLTAKVFADFYMGEAISAGIEVEYWDFTSIFFKSQFGMEDSSQLAKTRKFKSYQEIEQALAAENNLQQILFVSIMTFEARISKLYKILNKFDCQLSVFGRNMFPAAAPSKLSFFETISKINFSRVSNFLKNRQFQKDVQNGIIKKYDIVFLGGKMGWMGIGHVQFQDIEKAETVKVNSDDYDNYIKLKNCEPVLDHEYILFLDEYLPLHPDTALFKIKNVKPEDYYPELNNYFDRVEKQFSLPIVIAAHPKANRYKEEDFFNGRKVIFGKTAELSKHSNFVIAHDTTSINYPIAFQKKLHFITSINIEKGINIVHQNVLHFSNFLGCNKQYFNKNESVNLVEPLPVQNYTNYKFDFQTWPETKDTVTSEIFINFLKNSK